jgi:hypothetical protein
MDSVSPSLAMSSALPVSAARAARCSTWTAALRVGAWALATPPVRPIVSEAQTAAAMRVELVLVMRMSRYLPVEGFLLARPTFGNDVTLRNRTIACCDECRMRGSLPPAAG